MNWLRMIRLEYLHSLTSHREPRGARMKLKGYIHTNVYAPWNLLLYILDIHPHRKCLWTKSLAVEYELPNDIYGTQKLCGRIMWGGMGGGGAINQQCENVQTFTQFTKLDDCFTKIAVTYRLYAKCLAPTVNCIVRENCLIYRSHGS